MHSILPLLDMPWYCHMQLEGLKTFVGADARWRPHSAQLLKHCIASQLQVWLEFRVESLGSLRPPPHLVPYWHTSSLQCSAVCFLFCLYCHLASQGFHHLYMRVISTSCKMSHWPLIVAAGIRQPAFICHHGICPTRITRPGPVMLGRVWSPFACMHWPARLRRLPSCLYTYHLFSSRTIVCQL